jgi:hypothetical protein
VIEGVPRRTKEVTIDGVTYVLRQITVQESDEAFDAARGPDGEIDARLSTRLILAASIESPPTTLDDILQWPFPHYLKVLRHSNELNAFEGTGQGEE